MIDDDRLKELEALTDRLSNAKYDNQVTVPYSLTCEELRHLLAHLRRDQQGERVDNPEGDIRAWLPGYLLRELVHARESGANLFFIERLCEELARANKNLHRLASRVEELENQLGGAGAGTGFS